MRDLFKCVKSEDAGDNWPVCFVGDDEAGQGWAVSTDRVHGSEVGNYLRGAKEDAELIARLLNEHFKRESEV